MKNFLIFAEKYFSSGAHRIPLKFLILIKISYLKIYCNILECLLMIKIDRRILKIFLHKEKPQRSRGARLQRFQKSIHCDSPPKLPIAESFAQARLPSYPPQSLSLVRSSVPSHSHTHSTSTRTSLAQTYTQSPCNLKETSDDTIVQ